MSNPQTKNSSLVQSQIEFLASKFFDCQSLPGATQIARELLAYGRCIVAGDGIIWRGGVGNFIRRDICENSVGCTTLYFDLAAFLTWSPVIDRISEELALLDEQKTKLEREQLCLRMLRDLCEEKAK